MIVLNSHIIVKEFCIVLLGAPNIGRRSLKTRLLSEYSTRFGEVRARMYYYAYILLTLEREGVQTMTMIAANGKVYDVGNVSGCREWVSEIC